MYRTILNDYRSHFKSAMMRVWESAGWILVFLGYLTIEMIITAERELSFFLIAVPSIVAYMIARMYGGFFNKTFYLCPMDANERRNYAIHSYRLRIIITSTLFLLFNIPPVILGMYSIPVFLCRMLVFGCVTVSANIYCQSKKVDNKDVYPFVGNYMTVNICSNVYNFIAVIFMGCIDSYDIKQIDKWSIVMIAILVITQFIVTIYKVKKFYWQSIVVMEFYK